MSGTKEALKESLVGTTIEPELSQQSRATFEKYASKDEDGKTFMTEDNFVNAIAPASEDYVCSNIYAIAFPV